MHPPTHSLIHTHSNTPIQSPPRGRSRSKAPPAFGSEGFRGMAVVRRDESGESVSVDFIVIFTITVPFPLLSYILFLLSPTHADTSSSGYTNTNSATRNGNRSPRFCRMRTRKRQQQQRVTTLKSIQRPRGSTDININTGTSIGIGISMTTMTITNTTLTLNITAWNASTERASPSLNPNPTQHHHHRCRCTRDNRSSTHLILRCSTRARSKLSSPPERSTS